MKGDVAQFHRASRPLDGHLVRCVGQFVWRIQDFKKSPRFRVGTWHQLVDAGPALDRTAEPPPIGAKREQHSEREPAFFENVIPPYVDHADDAEKTDRASEWKVDR